MKGHRRKRGDAWELRVYAGTDPITGRKRVVTRTFRGSAKAADEELRNLINEVEGGDHGGSAQSVGRLLNDWLEFVAQDLSPTTMREYRRIVSKLPQRLKGTPLRSLTARDLDSLYTSLSPGSRRQTHAIMRGALGQAKKWSLVSRNVAESATPKAKKGTTREAPAMDEVTKMIVEAERGEQPDHQLATLIALAALTGARRGELLGLQWRDVDFTLRRLTISRSLAVVSRKQQILKDTKTHAARILALDDPSLAVLLKHRQHAEALARSGHADAPGPETPIITYNGVRPINPDYASHRVREIATACGVDTHLHALRHMAATQLIGAGVDMRTVATRMGHANPSTTMRVYAHALPERDREASSILSAVLPPPDQG